MKKIVNLLLILLMLCSCSFAQSSINYDEKYLNLVDTILGHSTFESSSNYFDISCDISPSNDAYRYYVIIDNPRIAMYGVEIIAFEKDSDVRNNMAANVGIFDDTQYNLIPGQANIKKGFVSGLNVSGVSTNESPTIRVLVQWHGKNQDVTQEFFEITIQPNEE